MLRESYTNCAECQCSVDCLCAILSCSGDLRRVEELDADLDSSTVTSVEMVSVALNKSTKIHKLHR